MGRVSYDLSDENRRRLELLTAFGILNGKAPSRDELVNEGIRLLFTNVYNDYCGRSDCNDLLRKMMEESI